jgi:hypothetical protein
MFQVEDRFGIEVPLDNPDDLRTLGDVARYVDGLIEQGSRRTRPGAGARGTLGPPPPGAR